jgi:integrase
MPKPKTVPSYRLHKATGQAVVVLKGRSFYLGKFGTTESKVEYRRILAEYLTLGNNAPPAQGSTKIPDLTIDELILKYWTFAEGYYVRDGEPSRELANIKDALRHVRPLYGETEVARFGPLALKSIRDSMIGAGLARKTINYRIGKIRRMFRWAVENQLVEVNVYLALKEVQGLMKGKGTVRETKPVGTVAIEIVEATLPFLTHPVAAMVKLQMLSGMRPGEAVAMQAGEIDPSRDVWLYKPSRHKTEGHGRTRSIALGPKAQEALRPFLESVEAGAYLFNPGAAVEARNKRRRLARVTPMTPSQAARKPAKGQQRQPGSRYSRNAYRTAIWRACDKAFPHPVLSKISNSDLTPAQIDELKAWTKAHRWHPNQLRHTLATEVRARFGLEASQAVLGHAKADVTQVYAERDLSRAMDVMRELG